MNYYHIIYRFDSDGKKERRSWEDFAENRDDAIKLLIAYARFAFGDIFKNIDVLSISEYKSVFK